VAAGGLVVGGCGGAGQQGAALVRAEGPYRGSEPPGGIAIPGFTLRDVVSGEDVSTTELRGRAVLVTFIDTDCADKCPLIASAIAEALRLLPKDARERTTALAISVSPLVDTRRSVRRFLRERRAEALTYLFGSVAELKPVWKRFGVVSAYETGDADAHSADVRVFDRQGIWVSTQHSGADLTPGNLAHDIELALKS
jgi:cytochrome oxidase Cu insertion factor (SCO1/SenC/PrrC family)